MGATALDRGGGTIVASSISSPIWESWKGASAREQFLMPCCGATAVPKTSHKGLQFFAHISDECFTAPETIWHLGAKALVVDSMRRQGATCDEEVFEKGPRAWKADVLVRIADRRIAIEIQRSYQHLRDFDRRQERYLAAGVECVWVLPPAGYARLARATGKVRLKEELGGNFPASGSLGPCISRLPVVLLRDPEIPEISGSGLFQASLDDWSRAVLGRQFLWQDGNWMIGDIPNSIGFNIELLR